MSADIVPFKNLQGLQCENATLEDDVIEVIPFEVVKFEAINSFQFFTNIFLFDT
jgi:hypothetical protein